MYSLHHSSHFLRSLVARPIASLLNFTIILLLAVTLLFKTYPDDINVSHEISTAASYSAVLVLSGLIRSKETTRYIDAYQVYAEACSLIAIGVSFVLRGNPKGRKLMKR